MKKKLINKVMSAIEITGLEVEKDEFGDKSASWIEFTKKTEKPSVVRAVISFDGKGEKITNICFYETLYKLDEDSTIKLF